MTFLEDKVADSSTGEAYRSSYAWMLTARGEAGRARAELDGVMAGGSAFDANWLSSQAECAQACILLGHRAHAEVVYERLLPSAGRPVTAGRAVCSASAADRHLGGLAALLGRRDDAVGHLGAAVGGDAERGWTVWAARARRLLEQL